MYFDIYFIKALYVPLTITQTLTRNASYILVLNRDADLHFVLAVLGERKIDFEIISK